MGICKACKSLKITRKKSLTYKQADNHQRRRRRYLKRWVKTVLAGKKEQLVYVDETGFAPSTFRTHARAFRGDKVYDKISGQRRPRTSIDRQL